MLTVLGILAIAALAAGGFILGLRATVYLARTADARRRADALIGWDGFE